MPATIGALLDRDVTAVLVPYNSPVVGMSIPQLQLGTATGATGVSIERGSDILLNPDGSWPLQVGDRVLLMGDVSQIAAVRRIFSA